MDWRVGLLRELGAPVTRSNLRFLSSWQRWEGGHTQNDARYNWLNTTLGDAYPSINSVGVRAYPTFQVGIQNIASTIQNGRYENILTGLQAGNPYKFPVQGDLSTWVSGSPTGNLSYASKVLGTKVDVQQPSVTQDLSIPGIPSISTPAKFTLSDGIPKALAEIYNRNNRILGLKTSFPKGLIQRRIKTKVAVPAAAEVSVPEYSDSTGNIIPAAFKVTHQTSGLEEYGATDWFRPAGSVVGAPVDGRIVRVSGGPGTRGKGIYGWSVYIEGDDGSKYFLTHFADLFRRGGRIRRGQPLGTVADYGQADHIHVGRKGYR